MIPYFETTCVVPYYPNRRDVTAELEAAVLVISPRNNHGFAYDGYDDSVPESEQLESRSSRYDTHGSLAHKDRRTGQRRSLSVPAVGRPRGGRLRCGSVLYRDLQGGHSGHRLAYRGDRDERDLLRARRQPPGPEASSTSGAA